MFPHDKDDPDNKDNEQSVLVIGDPKPLQPSVSFVEDKSNFTRKLRVVVSLSIFLPVIVLSLSVASHISPQSALALYLLVIHTVYFTRIAYIINGAQLYRILPEYGNVRGWNTIRVQKGLKIFPRFAVSSISELSAIRGTATHIGLLWIALNTFAVYFCVLVYEQNVWRQTVHQTIGAILIFIGCLGVVFVAIFELNPNNRAHKIVHYIGACCCLGTNMGLIVSNQFKSMISWILACVAFISAALMFFTYTTKMIPSDDPQSVSKLSKKCLIYESGI